MKNLRTFTEERICPDCAYSAQIHTTTIFLNEKKFSVLLVCSNCKKSTSFKESIDDVIDFIVI